MKALSTSILAVLLIASSVSAYENRVRIESKTFNAGQTACSVGIFISNAQTITGFVVPLELRSVTPGVFPTGNLTISARLGSRIDTTSLGRRYCDPPYHFIQTYATPDGAPCMNYSAPSWSTQLPPDYISPDAIMLAVLACVLPAGDDLLFLPPGADTFFTENASFIMTFDAPTSVGTFEIDTCCVRPNNQLIYLNEASQVVKPAFTKGNIYIRERSIRIESKTFLAGQTACSLGVFLSNNSDEIDQFSLPLEIRGLASNAFPRSGFSIHAPAASRMHARDTHLYLYCGEFHSIRYFAVPDQTACVWNSPVQEIDYVSPDACHYNAQCVFDPTGEPEFWYCPPGIDPPGTENASILIRFDAPLAVGQFEIDTCCVGPSSLLRWRTLSGETLVPEFTKGIITIACSCPCAGDPDCDGMRTTALDVVQTIDVAFRNGLETRDSGCLKSRTDVDCNGVTDVVDAVRISLVTFRGYDPAVYLCEPCE